MHKLDMESLEDAKSLLSNSNLDKLKILYLHGGSHMSLEHTKELLPHVLSNVRRQIYLDSFKLTEECLQMIFDYSDKCINLCLVNCKIGHIGGHFAIAEDRRYNMENLDLFWTCIKNEDHYLNEEKFSRLIRGMRETKLKSNLEKIHVCSDDFSFEDIKELLDEEHFEIEVVVDNTPPHPYE